MRAIEEKIKRAVKNTQPDILHSVLNDCQEQKGKVIWMTEQKKNKQWIRRLAAAAAVLAVVVGAFAGLTVYKANYAIASTVSLDVNPSIEIQINEKERVLAVHALNNDAEIVIGQMEFEGSSLEITVNALIGSLLKNGYLSELSNSILISVDHSNEEKSVRLKEKLTQEVHALLQTDTFSGAVLSQTVSSDSQLQTLAQEYGITAGKAQLIQQIITLEPTYSFNNLVPLSINELNLLLSSGQTIPQSIDSVGNASTKNYIGTQKAQENALLHAGIQADVAREFRIKLDCEDGLMVYEIDFKADGFAYEYEIEARTGDILEHKKERDDDFPAAVQPDATPVPENIPAESTLIGAERARDIAFAHAGIQASEAKKLDIETDYEHGVPVYEIEFEANAFEYEYEIHAKTGDIIKSEKEADD